MKKESNLWYYIGWIGIIIIIIWAILKSIGIIQSPIWVEILPPVVGGSIAIGSLLQKFKTTSEDVKEIKTELKNISGNFIKLTQDFSNLKGEHEAITNKKKH